jgi:hypothetical protein
VTKLRLILDTHRRNLRFAHYDREVVLAPLEHAHDIVVACHQRWALIDRDPALTREGKATARAEAGKQARAALAKWHEPRLKGIDADLTGRRAALLAPTGTPDPRRVEAMIAQLQKFTPQEIAVFYGAATDAERRAMEAASAAVGRVPLKSANGLEWKTLLDPDVVAESVMARAAATNPDLAQQVQDLTEIRDLQVRIANIAASEVGDAPLEPEGLEQ